LILNNKNTFFKSITTLTLTSTLLFANIDGYMTTYFVNGDGLAGGTSGTHATVKYFPTPTNQNSDTDVVKDIVTNEDTGAIWGMAYDTRNKNIYVSAAVKRHVGLGSQGIGGIYKIDISDIDNPSISNFTTVSDAGSVPSNSDRHLPADALDGNDQYPSRDPIFEEVGTMGLGDIDISTDGTKLYTMNLNTQSLIEIDIDSKSQTSYAVGDPFGDCGTSHVRPWAINTQNNEVHIGAICDNDLSKGSVVAKLNADGTFTAIAQQSLTDTELDAPDYRDSDNNVNNYYPNEWLTNSTMSNLFGGDDYPSYAQLILTDIMFDKDNSLILGFADRSGLQAGYGNYSPDSSDDTLYNVMAAGDVQRMCLSGETYYTEGTTQCPFNNEPVDSTKNEYYVGDAYYDNDDGKGHREVSLGGLAYDSTTDVVAVTTYDPVDDEPTYTAGAIFLKNSDGTKQASQLFAVGSGGVDRKISMGKAGGVGDIEALETVPTYTLGDKVWLDDNENGIQDDGENGVNDITVNLYSTTDCTGSITETITTVNGGSPATDGFYQFTNLTEGNYCIEFKDLPADHVITIDTGVDDTKNSDANTSTGKIENISLNADDLDEDMGIYLKPLVSIGSLVWEDLNQDGLQDDGESGISDVNVTLLDENGTEMSTPATITTGADGKYYFSALEEGSYSVRVTLPSSMGYVPCTTQVVADNDDTENDSNIKTSVDNVHTSGKFTLQADTEPTESNGKSGTDDADDTDDDNGNMTVDFCFYRPASLGDYVWKDSNKDGVQDEDEDGVSGVTVKLLTNCDSATVAESTSTDGEGKYLFSDLDSGDYCVEFSDLPVDYAVTTKGSGTATDSDAQTSAPYKTASTHLDPGENDMTWDMGIYSAKASIGNLVWYDNNANGVQDVGENGVNGIDVKLLDETCTNELNSTTTDSNGFYSFLSLTPDTYCLEFGDIPAGYAITQKDSGSDTIDSDVDPQTHKTIATTLDEGEDDTSWDMGIYPLGEIGDRVWDDENANGVQDAIESGVANVTVTLYEGDCTTRAKEVDGVTDVATINTTADGEYKFTDLPVGDYCVGFSNIPEGYKVSPQDRGGDDEKDSDVNVDSNKTISTTLDANESDMSWDMGIYKPATIGDKVWDDINGDGIQDGTEVGVKDVTVTLYDSSCNVVATDENGVNIPTQTTDVNGNYLFADVPPSDYCLGFTTLPAGYGITPQNKGGDDSKNSDVNVSTGKTVVITLLPGEDDRSWDMGIYEEASIGNYVWNDSNGNGEQEGTEVGVEDVRVTLYQADCSTVAISNSGENIVALKTDANGLYKFEHLLPARYCLGFSELPNGFGFTFKDTVADDTKDSDVDTLTGETLSTELVAGESDMTWDAGIFESASIGDKVWYDNNANGIQDAGENGVENITVKLYQSDCISVAVDELGVEIPNTKTVADGSYSFTSLVPNDYCVGFDLESLPEGYKVTSLKVNTTTAEKDSNANETTGKTESTSLAGGENDTSWDMGIYPLGEIGDRVWDDENANGVQDAIESGVANVTVTLYEGDCTTRAKEVDGVTDVATINTTADGEYKFTDLPVGDYCVGFSNIPEGYKVSPQDRGGDDEKDSDVNVDSNKTISTTLDANESDMSWDMGIYKPATIGDKVWDDINGDGIQDGTEVGVKDVTVTLYDSSCNVVATDENGVNIPTQTTDVNGNYLFADVPPSDYCLGFTTLPAGYGITPQNKGGDDSKNSDVNVSTGKTVVITLLPGEDDRSWDMGIYEEASIGNYVWNDSNGNGEQEGTEVGVEDVRVTLYQADCSTVAISNSGENIVALKTDANGLYKFEHLLPARYCLGFSELPNGFGFTFKDTVADDTKDSDVDTLTGETLSTELVAGESDMTWDAGIFESASIGDKVWYDNNANGIQDAGENGVENITVKLYQSDCISVAVDELGVEIPNTKTVADGSYSFTSLVPNDYCVGFDLESLPEGYKVTSLKVNTTTAEKDSNANETTGKTESTSLAGGENDTSWDMGIYKPATIGNFVWLDKNANGVQDKNESGVANITVRLYAGDCTTVIDTDSSGIAINPVETDNNGFYEFNNLKPEEYCIGFENIPTKYILSPINQGDDLVDSDVNSVSKKTISTLLESGEDDQSWDMGLYIPASIGDKVWIDTNADGIQDKNELGIADVTVTLYTGDCKTAVVFDNDKNKITPIKTDSNGLYKFVNLIPNDYCIGFSNLPDGYLISSQDIGTDNNDSDADIVTAKTKRVTLDSGENDTSWDMGIYRPATIGNRVWNDLDGNGEQDSGELGVKDVNVTLYTTDCITIARDIDGIAIPSILTDENGFYSFSDLIPNDYCLGFTIPTGYIVSIQNSGSDEEKDSDVNVDTNRTESIRLSSDENDTSWDMGIIIPASIGDKVWIDTNRDGVQDSNEFGLEDVNVTLYEADCTTAIKSVLTGKKGNYLFSDLLPNSYCIGVKTPNGYAITTMDASRDSQDSDVNVETERTISTTLESGENDLTWDVGLYQLSSIGDYVWFDENHDGIQDSNETAVPNIKVTLYESDCETVIKETRSGINGHYIFENLEPSEYCVGFDELPIGYQFTPNYDNSGAGSELDCNVDPGTGKTPIIELAQATNDLTWDMGIIPKCKDENGRSLEVFDDVFVASTTGPVTTLNILENDFGNLDIESIEFVTSKEAAILWENGTAVGGISLETVDRLVVPGEGVWEAKSDGTITFTAEDGFTGTPTPVYYVVRCKQGNMSNIAQAMIKGNCICDTYVTEESSVDSMSSYGMFSMLMLTSILALFLFRKEFEKSIF